MAKRNEAAESRPAVRPVRLTSDMSMPKLSAVEIGSYIAAFAGLFFVLHLQLLQTKLKQIDPELKSLNVEDGASLEKTLAELKSVA